MSFQNNTLSIRTKLDKVDKAKISVIILLVMVSISISVFQFFSPDLSFKGHLVLSAMIVAVALWSFGTKWVPISVGGLILLAILVTGGIDMPVVFNGFTNRALWILIPALFFGFALRSTGLGNRLAYWIIGILPGFWSS